MTVKKTVVLNLRDLPKTVTNGVYIGRGTKWGNPFVIGKDGTREECVAKYRKALWQNKQLLAEAGRELRGKKLLCFCAPQACHGDVLVRAIAWLDTADAAEVMMPGIDKPALAAKGLEGEAKLDDPKLIPSRWLNRDKDGIASELAF